MVKILHVLHAFSAGGMENGLVNIINGTLGRVDHELCFLTQAGDFLNRLNRPVAFHELQKGPGNDLGLIWRIRRIIRKSDADIVHTRNWSSFDGVLAACLTPGVALIHGEHGRDMSDPQGLIRRRNLARRLSRFRVQKFVAVSADLHRWLDQVVGLPGRQLVCIPNGVDTEKFQPVRDQTLRKELGITEEEFVVGTIGRLDPVKNHAGLIRAVERMNNGGVPVRLVIAGEGPERWRLEQGLKHYNSALPPILVGYRSDTARFYGLFDVFVLNSFAEGMSNTLLEAMSAGLPVICTAVGGNLELVEDGVRGRIIPSDDEAALHRSIEAYRSAATLREDHGKSAREFIKQNFSLSAMIEKYIDLYRSTAAAA